MLTDLRKFMKRNTDHPNKELKITKMNQSKTDNSIAKIKTSLETMDRINDTEKQINDLEGRVMEITQSEQYTGRQMEKNNKSNIWDIWDIKHAQLCKTGISETNTLKINYTPFKKRMKGEQTTDTTETKESQKYY